MRHHRERRLMPKITALVAETAPVDGDLIPIVDVSDTTQSPSGSTNKSTLAQLATGAPFAGRYAKIGSTSALGNLGTTETIDASTATRFTGNIDDNVTITMSNLSAVFDVVLIELVESGGSHTITWSGAVNTPDAHSDVNGDTSLFAVSFTADGPFVALVGTWS
jgi:hypothetical protein